MKSLRSKILGSFAIILSLLLILSIYSYLQINKFKAEVEHVLGNELQELTYWRDLNYSLANRTAILRAFLLTGNETHASEFENLTNENLSTQESLQKLNSSAEVTEILEKSAQWDLDIYGLIELYRLDPEAAIEEADRVRELSNELTADFENAVAENVATMGQLKQEIVETGNQIIYMTIIISVIAVALGIVVAFVLAHRITAPILEIVRRLKKVAAGDLTGEKVSVKSKDEVGQLAGAINDMISSLRALIGDVLENANNLAASSEEISASTEQIASGSQLQANNAGLASEMVKEMAQAIHAVSKNADDTSNASENMVEAAGKGNEVIQDTLQGMQQISEKILELSSKSVQIGEIVEVIDDIAEQTNLLALNAAIEAARAGEAGKGFAVVADEVRKLAERSSKATKEISELIQSIQANTDASVEAVNIGNEKANNAGKAFEEIISLVKISANKVAEIAAASEQQNAQSQEVLQSVESIAAVSEQTAAGVQETAATAQDLAKMAENLSQLAAKFNI
ncbi:methyl-accepting chemotaxis protein [Calidifontibacillus oryziterrae]|uniref:methyl-accepting chemotaxis protein n=1 Tax=Calidifontibacillus oryziterrae TaxID=1191699 RepID=UPI0002E81E41|nr:methyl-accepting chemotaxis protein [Calidifontibacillus oryziterrae]